MEVGKLQANGPVYSAGAGAESRKWRFASQ